MVRREKSKIQQGKSWEPRLSQPSSGSVTKLGDPTAEALLPHAPNKAGLAVSTEQKGAGVW